MNNRADDDRSMKPYFEFAKEENHAPIVLKFHNGVVAVVYDIYCTNSDCDCVDVLLSFVEADEINKKLIGKLFSFYINTKTWEIHTEKIENTFLNYSEMIHEFMDDLDEGLKETLIKRLAEAKEYGREEKFEGLTSDSCIGYAEAFGEENDEELFSFEYKGAMYFVDDQYCTNPECRCNEVILSFAEIVPGRKEQEIKFVVRMPFAKDAYQVEFANRISKGQIKLIMDRFKEHVHNDFGFMQSRYKKMKEFGRSIERKRQNRESQSAENSKIGSKIGRNDLCSCGSGKKYKRCCGK